MAGATLPVESGLVKSLARPGGNTTGLTFEASADLDGKRLEALKETVPKVVRVAVIGRSRRPGRPVWKPRVVIVSIDDLTMKDVPGAAPADQPLAWTPDGGGLFVREKGQNLARIPRLDLTTGRRILWRELAPSDPAGILGISKVAIGDNGSAWAYSSGRLLSDLYAIDGGWGK